MFNSYLYFLTEKLRNVLFNSSLITGILSEKLGAIQNRIIYTYLPDVKLNFSEYWLY